MEVARACVFALGDEGGGFGDFGAVEQAGREITDQLIPAVMICRREILHAVTKLAGKYRRRRLGQVGVAELLAKNRIGKGTQERDRLLTGKSGLHRDCSTCPTVEEGADGKRIVDGAHLVFAGRAEPAPAPEI